MITHPQVAYSNCFACPHENAKLKEVRFASLTEHAQCQQYGRIFENVIVKQTFSVQQFFFGQKLSPKQPSKNLRVQPLLFSLLLLSSSRFLFLLSFDFMTSAFFANCSNDNDNPAFSKNSPLWKPLKTCVFGARKRRLGRRKAKQPGSEYGVKNRFQRYPDTC